MTSNAQKLKIEHPQKSDFLYYMCLLDWRGAVLDEKTHKAIAQLIVPDGQETDGWHVTWKEDSLLKNGSVKPRFLLGFYHSRVIFRFELKECPETISRVREIRQAIEDYIESYLKNNIFTQSQKLSKIYPSAFIYPVFELNAHCPLWRFGDTSPYILPTTCFYTELRDQEQPQWSFLQIPLVQAFARILFPATVKMRISGANIIASPMSDWFFWNLTNLVYHEGLYRQCRNTLKSGGKVYKGLEARLEDFADRLMTSFSQSITNVMQVRLNWWLVLLTILLIVITLVLIME